MDQNFKDKVIMAYNKKMLKSIIDNWIHDIIELTDEMVKLSIKENYEEALKIREQIEIISGNVALSISDFSEDKTLEEILETLNEQRNHIYSNLLKEYSKDEK